MHRFPVSSDLLDSGNPVLPEDAARHLKVVRPKDGEVVELFDGRGATRRYAVTRAGLAAVAPRAFRPRPEPAVTLFACVTKGSRWDWTIEKAVELGVSRIVPVISERTIVRLPPAERAAKRARWSRVAEDAARQSDASWLPEIREAVDFPDVLPLVARTTCFVGALAVPPPPPLLEAASAVRASSAPDGLALFVGPEGDFSPGELAALCARAIPASFGPTVLRAETAAIFGLSVLFALVK